MNVRIPLLALTVLATSGCAMWSGHAPLECEAAQRNAAQPEITNSACVPVKRYTTRELVMIGMAEPDELIVRVPKFVVDGDGEKFLRLFVGYAGIKDVKWITDELYLVRLDSAGPREVQAERVDNGLTIMKSLASIRIEPNGIPAPLREILTYEKLFDFLPRISNPVNSPSVAAPSLAAIDPDFFKRSSAESNLVIHVLATPPPKDEEYVKQCGLRAINAERAWYDNGADASMVNMAIVDSGLVENHIDLYGNAEPASPAAEHLDKNGHGTHVAGIIGAISDDVRGVVGVTWKTKITAYGFLNAAGRGSLDGAVKQLKDALAATPKPNIVVLPWGAADGSKELRETLESAKDVLFVAPAGNSGQDACQYPVYPAAYGLPNLISVMATTCDDVRAGFSNYGKNVDLAAPGEGLTSNLRIYSTVLKDWGNLAGTSMSAAFVAGAAALVLQRSIDSGGTPVSPKQIKCWLRRSVTDVGLPNDTKGRLDLKLAVEPFDATECPP